MSSGMISAGSHASSHTISKPKISTKKSFLEPSSHLSFNTHFQKSSFSLRTHSKSIRTSPIKAYAAAIDGVYINSQSFYDLLGIPKSGTLSEIKKAYKQLARKYHPDVSPPERKEEYTKKFIQGLDARDDWEQRWQSQLAELIRKSNAKDLESISWGARMRRQRSYCH
ncbi:hypothetical protein GH714_026538 [Hevea brasiliensis]|uniref:J domain-containing protein n=1 Tax=Hevea brasiliensis TaxID=3981 RepID=A0A6A6KCY1_HEVBR|nr:hypothetical protein GH714_026538 [Hevea brasiliensis]